MATTAGTEFATASSTSERFVVVVVFEETCSMQKMPQLRGVLVPKTNRASLVLNGKRDEMIWPACPLLPGLTQ